MTIKVCDAIMGSGKSSAAINFMNEHPERKFIYITPFLEEASRIKYSCPMLNFREPSSNLPEFGFRKYQHTLELIKEGHNIASTHNMFTRYTTEMVESIKAQGYTLIVDEAMEVLNPSSDSPSDIMALVATGNLKQVGDMLVTGDNPTYQRGRLDHIVHLSKGNRIVNIPDSIDPDKKVGYLYWLFSKEIFESFSEVYLLTYMFDCQMIKYYFDMNDMDFEYIGVRRDDSGYHFSDSMEYVPEYTASLSDKIHIFENKKLNSIGNNKNALSYTWFTRSAGAEAKEKLKSNLHSYFMYHFKTVPGNKKLWASFKCGEKWLKAKGYARNHIAFNAKATNEYRDKQVLAYCVNIFMQPSEKVYLLNKNIDVLEDKYALSVMLQWIWRSAIRDGKEIWIYIPSRRMRNLLKDWIKETEEYYKSYQERK